MAMMLVDIPDTDEVGHKIFIPVIHEEIVETSQKDGVMMDHVYQKSRDDVHAVCVQTTITMEDMEKAETKLKSFEDSEGENMMPSLVDRITQSDETVRKYTGLPSLLMLNTLFGILKKAASPVLHYWSGQGSCNLPSYHEDPGRKNTGPPRKLTLFNEFLLTLVRLRLALLTFVIADMFNVSNSRVSQIFTTWINFMYAIFCPLLKWPSSDRIKKYMPRSFKETFPNTTIIIDCTEFFIKKPKSPTAQSQTYSTYKHRNTCKALLGISPSGAFIYVSDLWGGNTSDRYITMHSDFLDQLTEVF